MSQSAYPTNDADSLRELAAAADVYLQGQLSAAIAADQRALVFAGFLAAATAAAGGAAVSASTSAVPDHTMIKVALCAAAGLLISMAFAVVTARPAKWFFPGSHPVDWQEDFATAKPTVARLQELLADYDDRIAANHRTMRDNGRWMYASALTGFAVLLLAGLALAWHIW